MNLGDIIVAVKRQFGDESGAQITNSDIIRWANDAQVDIARRTETLVSHRETEGIPSDGSYLLPTDFMFMKRVTFNNYVLHYRSLDDLDQRGQSVETAASGEPNSYYLTSSTLHLYPKPSTGGVGVLDIFYARTPTRLVDAADTPEIPGHMHEDIIRYCLVRAKELDDDLQGAERIGAEYDARVAQSHYETITQTMNSYPAIRLSPGDDW